MVELIEIETKLTPKETIENIKNKASSFDFIIRSVFDMSEEFKKHGIDVNSDFEYYSIMICNPQKAYNSIRKNPIRGAILLPPKQIIVYSENNRTTVAYMKFDKNDIFGMLPDDKKFQEGLSESCNKIVTLINKIDENKNE